LIQRIWALLGRGLLMDSAPLQLKYQQQYEQRNQALTLYGPHTLTGSPDTAKFEKVIKLQEAELLFSRVRTH
jgi:hypothetical protein